VFGATDSSSFFVASRSFCALAEIMTFLAPARANAVAIPFPMPLLPPTVRIVVSPLTGYNDTSPLCYIFHSLTGINCVIHIPMCFLRETIEFSLLYEGILCS
jgi:hypothetical protein